MIRPARTGKGFTAGVVVEWKVVLFGRRLTARFAISADQDESANEEDHEGDEDDEGDEQLHHGRAEREVVGGGGRVPGE